METINKANNAPKIGVFVQNELNLDFNEVFKDAIAMGAEIVHQPLYHTHDTAKIIEAAKDVDYAVIGREPWMADTFEACKGKLKGIARFGAGFETIDLEAASRCGVPVSNAPGVSAASVAEHTLALTLAVMRRVVVYHDMLNDGGVTPKMTSSVEGTVAILGFGNIGQEYARMLSVFPVKVIAYDPYPNYEIAKKLNVEYVDMETALTTADVISLHLPAVKEMKDFICKETIAKMKDGVYIINTSRGYVLNEDDLVEALESGKVAGAGLDAFKVEPFDQNSPLKGARNCVITPHSAAVSTQAVRNVFHHCAKVITCYMKGVAPCSLLNPNYETTAQATTNCKEAKKAAV